MPIELLNMDCMEYMAGCDDKQFDLAIVDPPYGLGFGAFNRTNRDSNGNRYKANKYHNGDWDKATPTEAYFIELMRVSKNQIIWGGNYFSLPPTQCFLFWYKQNPVPNFADGELAWTSFSSPAMCFDYRYYGNLEGKTTASDKIHPTQKPIPLYKWILKNYASPEMKIIDTHLGSGSSAIAASDFGSDFIGLEIDSDYFNAAKQRLDNHLRQYKLTL